MPYTARGYSIEWCGQGQRACKAHPAIWGLHCEANTSINESISCHSEGAKRLRNLKLDPSGKAFRMTTKQGSYSNDVFIYCNADISW